MPTREADKQQLTKADYETLAAFRAAMRKFVRFTEEGARSVGVTPQQHQVLLCIMGQPARDWALVGDIAESLQIKHHAAVGLVDRCAAAGLVVRKHDTEDRRHVKVELTSEGAALLNRLSIRNWRELNQLRTNLYNVIQSLSAE